MKKEELYKVTDILNDVLSNYLRGSEAEEVIAKLEESVEDSELIKEEPTSEDLGEYINDLSKQFPEVSFAKLSRIAVRVAKWQKQQMMKDAIDGEIRFGTVKVQKEDIKEAVKSLCEGDKVKLIVIKK